MPKNRPRPKTHSSHLISTDAMRLDALIRTFRLSRPSDAAGEFTYPKKQEDREELAAFLFDVAPLYLVQLALRSRPRRTVSWREDLPTSETNLVNKE